MKEAKIQKVAISSLQVNEVLPICDIHTVQKPLQPIFSEKVQNSSLWEIHLFYIATSIL